MVLFLPTTPSFSVDKFYTITDPERDAQTADPIPNVQKGEKRKSMIPKKSLRTEADAPAFDISAAADDKQQQKSNLIEVGIPSGGAEP